MTEKKMRNYILGHHRPGRLHAFLELDFEAASDATYWKLLREVWEDSEGVFVNRRIWLILLNAERANREAMMTAKEQALLASLPETMTIFRGYSGSRRSGISWTLEQEKAIWFAGRFAVLYGPGKVVSGECEKANVIAFLNDREENEIMIDPRHVVRMRSSKMAL